MYKLTLCYDGTEYHGWQRQQNAYTVQQCLEEAVSCMLKRNVTIEGCSRTDAGVHAREYVCSFGGDMSVPLDKVPYALNALLPDDICVLKCERERESFHARFSCKGKEYRYVIDNSPNKNPFTRNYAWHYPFPLDFEKMQEASLAMTGIRDYSAFCASGAQVRDKVRNLKRTELSKEGNIITLKTEADGYLYNMVRIIAGTLVYSGNGKIAPCDINDIIESGDRRKAGITAPPRGLYLEKVFY